MHKLERRNPSAIPATVRALTLVANQAGPYISSVACDKKTGNAAGHRAKEAAGRRGHVRVPRRLSRIAAAARRRRRHLAHLEVEHVRRRRQLPHRRRDAPVRLGGPEMTQENDSE